MRPVARSAFAAAARPPSASMVIGKIDHRAVFFRQGVDHAVALEGLLEIRPDITVGLTWASSQTHAVAAVVVEDGQSMIAFFQIVLRSLADPVCLAVLRSGFAGCAGRGARGGTVLLPPSSASGVDLEARL